MTPPKLVGSGQWAVDSEEIKTAYCPLLLPTFIVSGRRPRRRERLHTSSSTQNYEQNIRDQNDHAKCKNYPRLRAGPNNRFFRGDCLLRWRRNWRASCPVSHSTTRDRRATGRGDGS